MRKSLIFTVMTCALLFNACKSGKTPETPTLAETKSSYTYIPFDPLPVSTVLGNSCDCHGCKKCDTVPFRSLLESFPDQTVRLSIAKIEKSGKASYGSFASAEGEQQDYRVILDYVNVDVTRRDFLFDSYKELLNMDGTRYTGSLSNVSPKTTKEKTFYEIKSIPQYQNKDSLAIAEYGKLVSIPVYVGVGLRLTANVRSLKAGASLSGLGAIAAEVKAGNLRGSLTVQTLGITGKNIAASLPLPSEINETTIQNALIAIGSIKAQLYDTENTIISPRVVGIYKPIEGGNEVINAIIADLAKTRVKWNRPCDKKPLYADYLNEKTPSSNRKN